MATENLYGAVLLDVMLPGFDGFELCRRLRQAGVWAPVLMLTARDEVGDRVRGLDAGADDYLVKPFSLIELAARLRALARRDNRSRPTVLSEGDLKLDPAAKRAWRGDALLKLSPTESDGGLVIEVHDSGPGFPAQFLPHAFERFGRPDSGRARGDGGAGLGLAIVAAIALAHGGRATAANRRKGGAVVRLNLPDAVRAAPADAGNAAE
jgi:hypothetical protein